MPTGQNKCEFQELGKIRIVNLLKSLFWEWIFCQKDSYLGISTWDVGVLSGVKCPPPSLYINNGSFAMFLWPNGKNGALLFISACGPSQDAYECPRASNHSCFETGFPGRSSWEVMRRRQCRVQWEVLKLIRDMLSRESRVLILESRIVLERGLC